MPYTTEQGTELRWAVAEATHTARDLVAKSPANVRGRILDRLLAQLDREVARVDGMAPAAADDRRATLTPRQLSILGYIECYRREHGYSPTIREIGAREGIKSPNGVIGHLKALEKKGLIRHDRYLSRSIVPTG